MKSVSAGTEGDAPAEPAGPKGFFRNSRLPGALSSEGAEIERSIISDGARIMHVGGRIEASTVGRSARIFRDFALPRAMRLHVGDGVELALN